MVTLSCVTRGTELLLWWGNVASIHFKAQGKKKQTVRKEDGLAGPGSVKVQDPKGGFDPIHGCLQPWGCLPVPSD